MTLNHLDDISPRIRKIITELHEESFNELLYRMVEKRVNNGTTVAEACRQIAENYPDFTAEEIRLRYYRQVIAWEAQ